MKLFSENSLLIFFLTDGAYSLTGKGEKEELDKSEYIPGPDITFGIVNTAIVLMDMHLADHIRDPGDLDNVSAGLSPGR